MSLSDWLADGTVKRQATRASEIERLFALVDRDLADASIPELSVDRRFTAAYGAALELATIVVRASGYRVSSSAPGQHFKTIALLPQLMGDSQRERREYLDSCRRARNEASYDRINVVSDAEVQELLEEVGGFRSSVVAWLQEHHPGLV